MSRITIPVALACALLGGAFAGGASGETLSPDATKHMTAMPKAAQEEYRKKLKTFTCEALDDAMKSSYTVACMWDIMPDVRDKWVAKFGAEEFNLQKKEYKSRCKAEPAKLKDAKKSNRRACTLVPDA